MIAPGRRRPLRLFFRPILPAVNGYPRARVRTLYGRPHDGTRSRRWTRGGVLRSADGDGTPGTGAAPRKDPTSDPGREETIDRRGAGLIPRGRHAAGRLKPIEKE